MTLFSDAVVAIAITLLALELPVPEGDTASAFWTSARHNDGHYAAFLISFVVIAAAWGDHHDVFRYATGVDSRLRTFNMIWLLTIVLNPFATRMLTSAGHPSLDVHAYRFGFYALLQVLESGALVLMLARMDARGQLPSAPRRMISQMTRRCYVLMAGFGLSIPLFFVTTDGWILWFLLPLLAGKATARRRRGRPGRREEGDHGPARR